MTIPNHLDLSQLYADTGLSAPMQSGLTYRNGQLYLYAYGNGGQIHYLSREDLEARPIPEDSDPMTDIATGRFRWMQALPKGESLDSALLEKYRRSIEGAMRDAKVSAKSRKGLVDLDSFTALVTKRVEQTVRVAKERADAGEQHPLVYQRQYVLLRATIALDLFAHFAGNGVGNGRAEVAAPSGDRESVSTSSYVSESINGWVEDSDGELLDISTLGGWQS